MSANTILTSIVTGGTNTHTTTAEEANALATDFVTQGVVGAITLNTGSGGTGSFCVNADASPDMGVTVKAGQAYITATPSGQNSQVLRARAAADYTTYTINANTSGSTKYDWIYLKVDATKANNPAADASDVVSIYTSRSSSNSTDNGSPPTYGLLLAVVTVANGASSITNSNITDKRFNTSIGAQNGSLIINQNGTGTDAIIQAAGIDSSVTVDVKAKGSSGVVKLYDGSGNELLKTATTASAVNEITVTNAATGTAPQISATGDDTNIDVEISGKGTGTALVSARKQAITTNSTTSGLRIEYGWSFINQGGSSNSTLAITFPTAFSAAPTVFISLLGILTSDPTAIGDFVTSLDRQQNPIISQSITTTGFIARSISNNASSPFSANERLGFAWFALGPA